MSEKIISYAVRENLSRGREFAEKPHSYRSDFERDRDRIIHCQGFRRMEGKTQVFTPGLDDSYRNRLTHSIEVSQIGRTIAKALGFNESLTEAICLAHDLGHSPFGHSGEKALDSLMAQFGGFEHNRQSLRIVTLLEHPYPDFCGLNLMYETRLGLAMHRSTYDEPQAEGFSEKNCSLEGQAADIADRIAYNCHDLEDGMQAGLIEAGQLEEVEIFALAQNLINAKAIADTAVRRTRTAKAIIEKLVSDCIDASKKVLEEAQVKTVDDVYGRSENLIVLSAESEKELAELEDFLLRNFYMHESLVKTANDVKKWLGQIFEAICSRPREMPVYYQKLSEKQGLERSVCDYIAGMTDRFCLKWLEKICA